MSLSLNYPTIAPSLTLDFANTKTLDPRITFTRASAGTFYNGVTTAKAEENLLQFSQEFNQSSYWAAVDTTISTNAVAAPDGTTTAETFTYAAAGANARVVAVVPVINGATYTFSVFLKGTAGQTVGIEFDTSPGTVVTLTSTWARYTVTNAATSASVNVRIISRSGNTATVFDVWGAQLEQRSAVTAYTATTTQPITNYIPVLQTAQNNVARFDHNPITGESLGLEIEEQRTNLFLRSDDFASASWGPIQTTVTSNTIVAPDGTLTGDKLVENTTTNAHFIRNNEFVSYTSGTAYTISVYAKKAERNFICLFLPGSNFAPTGRSVIFNLDTGLISFQESGTTATITNVGNGWYRCSVTATANTTSSAISNGFLINTDGTSPAQSYTGNGYAGIYIWGAQLEAGAFPTSYIPTVASQVTRSADSAVMTGANFSSWYRADEGTICAEAAYTSASSAFPMIASINDNSGANNLAIIKGGTGSNNIVFEVVSSNAFQAQLSIASASANTNFKYSAAYRFNDFAASLNAGAVSTDTLGTIPVVNQLSIGSRAGSLLFTGTIKKLAYYPARIPNAQLQALTTV